MRDKDGNIVPVGTPGYAWAKNPAGMTGYYKNEDCFVDGWFDTGDIMKVDEDGYYYFVDRAKDMVKTGGENVYCMEVENILGTHPAVADCAVFGIPDPRWSEAVVAAVILNNGMEATEDELIAYCKNHMASYKKPQRIFFEEVFPRTTVGKINKIALRTKYGE